MSNKIEIPTMMRVEAASDGGFIVYTGPSYRGDGYSMPSASYAGPLADCLDYLRDKLAPMPEKTCICGAK